MCTCKNRPRTLPCLFAYLLPTVCNCGVRSFNRCVRTQCGLIVNQDYLGSGEEKKCSNREKFCKENLQIKNNLIYTYKKITPFYVNKLAHISHLVDPFLLMNVQTAHEIDLGGTIFFSVATTGSCLMLG